MDGPRASEAPLLCLRVAVCHRCCLSAAYALQYVRMVKLTLAMGFVAHWVTCAWRFVYEALTYDQRQTSRLTGPRLICGNGHCGSPGHVWLALPVRGGIVTSLRSPGLCLQCEAICKPLTVWIARALISADVLTSHCCAMTKVESHEWTYDQLGDNSAEITYFLQGYLQGFLTVIGACRVVLGVDSDWNMQDCIGEAEPSPIKLWVWG
eukprot:1153698-Pelagomonas_calceolata.AAC.2